MLAGEALQEKKTQDKEGRKQKPGSFCDWEKPSEVAWCLDSSDLGGENPKRGREKSRMGL